MPAPKAQAAEVYSEQALLGYWQQYWRPLSFL